MDKKPCKVCNFTREKFYGVVVEIGGASSLDQLRKKGEVYFCRKANVLCCIKVRTGMKIFKRFALYVHETDVTGFSFQWLIHTLHNLQFYAYNNVIF